MFGMREEHVESGCAAARKDGELYWNEQEASAFGWEIPEPETQEAPESGTEA